MLLSEPWLTSDEPEVMPKPWVKWAYQPARAQDVPGAFMRAYATAIQPPAGPVFLSLPLDDWAAPALGPAVVRSASIRTGPDPARLRRLAGAIAAADRPVLIFGAAVARDRAGISRSPWPRRWTLRCGRHWSRRWRHH